MATNVEIIERFQATINSYDQFSIGDAELQEHSEVFTVAANSIRILCAEDADWDSILAFLCILTDFHAKMIFLGITKEGRPGGLQALSEAAAIVAQLTVILNSERLFQ